MGGGLSARRYLVTCFGKVLQARLLGSSGVYRFLYSTVTKCPRMIAVFALISYINAVDMATVLDLEKGKEV